MNNFEAFELMPCLSVFKHLCHKKRFDMVRYLITKVEKFYLTDHYFIFALQYCPEDIISKIQKIREEVKSSTLNNAIGIANVHVNKRNLAFILKDISSKCRGDWINGLDKIYISQDIQTDIISVFLSKPDYPVLKYLQRDVRVFCDRYGIFLLLDYNKDILKYILKEVIRY